MKRKIRDFNLINQIIAANFFNNAKNIALIPEYLLPQHIERNI